MKRRLEQQVWFRRLMVRIRLKGWVLRVTPEGVWSVRHPKGGLIIRPRQPTSRDACSRIVLEMRAQERAIRRNERKRKKEGPWGGSAGKSNKGSRRGSEHIPTLEIPAVKRWQSTSCGGSAARSMVTN